MTEDVMTIREMCDAYNVTPRTLRFYEAKELLFPIRKGQRRLFTRRDRARLSLILRFRRYGISLESLRQLLDLYHLGDGQLTQFCRTLDVAKARMSELQAERTALDQSIAELGSEIAWIESALAERRHRCATQAA